jgi:hypothetical protein
VAAAGTLGLTQPAAAQIFFQKGIRTPAASATKVVQQSPSGVPTARIDETTVHLIHTRAQMAWLADPVTFAYNLGVHATPQGLEVTGFVPNDTVRQRAMQIAQKHSALPLTDGLKIHPGMTLRLVQQVSRAELQHDAAAALHEVFGDRAKRWHVVADADGRVTVGGSCASLDEQVQISQCMRRVSQCACVSNHLTLGQAPTAVAVVERFPTPVVTPQITEPVMHRAERTETVTPPITEPVMVHSEKKLTVTPPPIAPMPQEPPVLSPTVLAQPDVKVDIPAVVPPPTVLAQTEVKVDTPAVVPPPIIVAQPNAKVDSPAAPAVTVEKAEPKTPRVEPALIVETPKTTEKAAAPTVAAAKEPAVGEVYETTGEIQFDAPSGPLSADSLRQAILTRCGASLREVRIEILRDQRLHITLRVAPNTDRSAVEQQIRQIPDVASYPHPVFWD